MIKRLVLFAMVALVALGASAGAAVAANGENDELDPAEEKELIAEWNAETDALVKHLKGLGFKVSVETDENGLREPVLDEDDEAVIKAIDEFYDARFKAEVAEWTDREKADWNTMIDEEVAELAELGIEAKTRTVAPGVKDLVWTDEIAEAFGELEDELWDDEMEPAGEKEKASTT